jgi:hypothetical protein
MVESENTDVPTRDLILKELNTAHRELKLQRKILIDELENGRIKEKAISEKITVQRAFNDTVKEMRDTLDIRQETLETNAAIMGITPQELYNKAEKEAGWKSE